MEYRFSFEGYKGASVKAVTLRETTGADEETAAAIAKAKGSMFAEELLRLSIVAVDDAPAAQPYAGLDGWNSRTRTFVLRAWQSINSIGDEEAQGFLRSGTPSGGSASAAGAFGASGSGSGGTSRG